MMIYLKLVHEFIKIGIFSFGGGYATIPFLYNISEVHGWFTIKELTQIIAVAAMTPGPVGINAATYAGLKSAGILGAALATASEIIPSFIAVIIVSKLLKKYSENFYVKAVIESLKPISIALLIAVLFKLLMPEIRSIKTIILLTGLLLMSLKSKKEPLFYMLIAGCFGIIFSLFHY